MIQGGGVVFKQGLPILNELQQFTGINTFHLHQGLVIEGGEERNELVCGVGLLQQPKLLLQSG